MFFTDLAQDCLTHYNKFVKIRILHRALSEMQWTIVEILPQQSLGYGCIMAESDIMALGKHGLATELPMHSVRGNFTDCPV